MNSSKDDDTSTFRIMQEVAVYFSPTVLTEDEKMSAILYWRRHANSYPNLSCIAKVYLTLSTSSVQGYWLSNHALKYEPHFAARAD